MKKMKFLFTAAAFALCITACSSSRNNSSTPTNPGAANSSGVSNPGNSGNTTTDSTQHR